MLSAGKLDRVVQFLRRAPLPASPSAPRGFEPAFPFVWGKMEPQASIRIAFGEFRASVPAYLLTVRDSPDTRAVAAPGRVVVDDVTFAIRAVRLPERADGSITMELIGLQGANLYAAYVDEEGEVVTLRRVSNNGTVVAEVNARARVTGYKPKDLVSGVRQGERNILLLAADVEAGAFPLPVSQNDEIVVRGQTLTMLAMDDSTHRFAGTLYAYEIVAGG